MLFRSGFLVNRLLSPYLNEAVWCFQDGDVSIKEIDQDMVAFGMPVGPFMLLDTVGLDIAFEVARILRRRRFSKPWSRRGDGESNQDGASTSIRGARNGAAIRTSILCCSKCGRAAGRPGWNGPDYALSSPW